MKNYMAWKGERVGKVYNIKVYFDLSVWAETSLLST